MKISIYKPYSHYYTKTPKYLFTYNINTKIFYYSKPRIEPLNSTIKINPTPIVILKNLYNKTYIDLHKEIIKKKEVFILLFIL